MNLDRDPILGFDSVQIVRGNPANNQIAQFARTFVNTANTTLSVSSGLGYPDDQITQPDRNRFFYPELDLIGVRRNRADCKG